MGVSLNGGTSNLHSKKIILSSFQPMGLLGKPTILGTPHDSYLYRGVILTHPVTSSTPAGHPMASTPVAHQQLLQAETEVLAPDYSLMPPIEEFSDKFWVASVGGLGFWVEVGC